MNIEEPVNVMSERLEQRVRKNLIDIYSVSLTVKWDHGREEEAVFEQNKKKLLDYCRENEVEIDGIPKHFPMIHVKTIGRKILELSTQEDYMFFMDLNDQPDFAVNYRRS